MPAHNEQTILPFTPQQMFDLVMDIERYPEFLPWCSDLKIIERKKTELLADMSVGYKFFRETFRTRVKFVQDKEIHIEYLTGPLKHLKNDWLFSAEKNNSCKINFHIDFEFQNRLLQAIAESFFNKALGRMMAAFETRATELYA
jgi:coenzyme Q-binding protein COQ10